MNVYETRLNDIAKQLYTTQGAFDLVQKLRCPLAELGECPVFRSGLVKATR